VSHAAAEYLERRSERDDQQRIQPFAALLGNVSSKRVLEYGCGDGELAVRLARSGACVSAFDSSREAVAATRRLAERSGVRLEAVAAAAERLPYADETFDIVLGRGILHLLDVERARAELLRVLKPGGRAVFSEPAQGDDLGAWSVGFSEFGHRELGLLARLKLIPLPRNYHCRLVWMVK
jgi:2-polyprenyl-3-methyl-5-hydroxy-6-metoxy-1,4-benzoquinol methylase